MKVIQGQFDCLLLHIKKYPGNSNTFLKYRMHTIITCCWLLTALNYNQGFWETDKFLVIQITLQYKLQLIFPHYFTLFNRFKTALHYKPQWKIGLKLYKPRFIMANIQYIKGMFTIFQSLNVHFRICISAIGSKQKHVNSLHFTFQSPDLGLLYLLKNLI